MTKPNLNKGNSMVNQSLHKLDLYFSQWKKCVIVATMLLLGACGTVTAIVPDAEGVNHVSAIGMGCNKPYKLTQDCSGFSGAERLVELSEFRFKIAGSEDGSIVFMMSATPNSDSFSGKSSEVANIAYELTKKFLLDNGVKVTQVEPVSSGALLSGYIITTDGNAYQVLSKMSVNGES
jgi:hypothetical protein